MPGVDGAYTLRSSLKLSQLCFVLTALVPIVFDLNRWNLGSANKGTLWDTADKTERPSSIPKKLKKICNSRIVKISRQHNIA